MNRPYLWGGVRPVHSDSRIRVGTEKNEISFGAG